ncbi:MAG: LPS export ABC transporter periplasmic protein LptC [Alphaproteobacteria bacterium]|nr:LPS export ABC transporter periplasmic protein LptC [Alphaproteobacteria bacterium]
MTVRADLPRDADTPVKARRQGLPFSPRRTQTVSRAYGRFVGIMRILLPTIATALLILVALWPQLSDTQRRYAITPAKIAADAAKTLTMVNGVYTGIDDKRRPYTLTAETVSLSNSGLSLVALGAPKADLLMEDGSWVAVTARDGTYDRDKKLLKLRGAVNLFHDSGYEFHTDAAAVDMMAGDAYGTDPVAGQGPFGNIKSEGFIVRNRGERIEFTGKATLILRPNQAPGG